MVGLQRHHHQSPWLGRIFLNARPDRRALAYLGFWFLRLLGHRGQSTPLAGHPAKQNRVAPRAKFTATALPCSALLAPRRVANQSAGTDPAMANLEDGR